jgi:NitT/TauT family transport system substrate-binding protein
MNSTLLGRMVRSGCLLALTAVAGSSAWALDAVKGRLDFLPHGLHAPFYLAVEKGWFAEQGLDVTIDDGNGTGPALALIAAGQYDIAQISLGALPIARDKGMPVKAIATIVRKGDVGIVVDNGAKVSTPKDLEGKTVLYAANSIETPFIDTYFKRAGVDKSKVNLMNVDASAKITSYMAGKGDGVFTPVPMYTLKGISPRDSKGLYFSDVGINIPSFGLVASEDTIAKRPKMLASFVAVFQRSWIAIVSGGMEDEAVAAMIKDRPNAKLDPKIVKAQLESAFPFLDDAASAGKPMLWAPPADWASAVKVMEEVKLVKEGTDPTTIYTNEFVPTPK